MAERERCPNCGSELPINAPQGLCPACLFRQGPDTEAPAPHGQPTAPGETLEEFVPTPGAVTAAGSETTASLITGPSESSPDPTAANPVIPRGGPNGDEGSLEPGVLVRYFGDYELIRGFRRVALGGYPPRAPTDPCLRN